MQVGLFSAVGATVSMPLAPALVPHQWPYPGLSGEDSAKAGLANSEQYADLVAAVIKNQGGARMTDRQVLELIPGDWRALLGRWAHANLSPRQGESRGVDVKYVGHEGGGFHFSYQAQDAQGSKSLRSDAKARKIEPASTLGVKCKGAYS